MFIIDVELKMTEKKGLGVFATKDILPGQTIWFCDSVLTQKISDSVFESLPEVAKRFITKYATHHITKGYYFLDNDHSRFMNHSKNPNTDFTSEDYGYATREIKAGEEITCDYTTLSDEERGADSLGFVDIEI